MDQQSWNRVGRLFALCLLVVAAGCAQPPGDDCPCLADTGGDVDDGGGVDVDDVPDPGDRVEADVDDEVLEDGAEGGDTGPVVPGLVCQECADDADCAEGYPCVALPSGVRVCLQTCNSEIPDCPPRFDCVESRITPLPDPVCAPVGERCCVDGDYDDHGVGVGCRGTDCDDTDPGVHSDAPEVCDTVDNDCDGEADEGNPGGGVVCATGLPGACGPGVTECREGTVSCVPEAGETDEVCDGLDNDCNGWVDEGTDLLALTRSCYDGPAGTEGLGACTAGVQTCAGGEYRACVGQVLPSTEVCDGADNDCDGVADDGNPGGGMPCTTTDPGVCAAGVAECRAGTVQCVGPIAPGSQPEICDWLDNDCDGEIDEDFGGRGAACTVGLGICRRSGVTACDATDPTAPATCSVVPGTPNPAETCDYVDDDCDGQTDEGFRNLAGVYFTVANCGACGFDCNATWPGGAAFYHVVPICDVSGTPATCGFRCETGWADVDGVRENGCEMFPETDTIYVSTPANGGLDTTSCGAWDAPCATIGYGISRATWTGRVRVRVSAGLYRENISLVSGISVLGGHSHLNWVRNRAVYGTTIRGLDAAVTGAGANDRIVVTAVGITTATELSGFMITGVNAGPGGNAIGIYVRDSNNNLLIQDNDIAAGAAGNGTTGAAGTPGASGASGSAGVGPVRRTCGSASTAGAAAGTLTCGTTVTSGGHGGDATNPTTTTTTPTRSGSGANGSTTSGGTGGAGGYHMIGTRPPGGGYSCVIVGSPIEGGVGQIGTSGTDGAGGAGATDVDGLISANHWRGRAGAVGVSGTYGGGGGGGGSPGGVYVSGTTGYCLYPATGGGGGAGGCGGALGGSGGFGGGSFAIFVLHTTTPASAAVMPRITGNSLRRGSGGRGGDGGTGGGGGQGGLGGPGGPRDGLTDDYAFCLVAGGPGGAGGRGGHAGGGGGGGGGVSYDVWISRPGTATPDYSGNTFEIAGTVATGGTGGTGGNSSNTTVGLGTAGVAGAYGTVRLGL